MINVFKTTNVWDKNKNFENINLFVNYTWRENEFNFYTVITLNINDEVHQKYKYIHQ